MPISKMHIIMVAVGMLGLPVRALALDIAPSAQMTRGLAVPEIPVSLELTHNGHSYDLELLGSGVRKQLMFKVYESAAYAESGANLSAPFQAIMQGTFVKHLRLIFIRNTTGHKVRTAVESGFRQAQGSPRTFAPELETLLSYLQQGVRAGEVLSLTWIPGEGLVTVVEGREYPLIPGDAFARAVFMVWFGERPVSKQLKRDMIRLVPSGRP